MRRARRARLLDPCRAEPDPSISNGDAPENLLYPVCFRDSSEIRAVSEQQWWEARGDG